MKISLVIPVYNLEQYIDNCLDSLVHQDLDCTEYEIIIVNDGSTDNTLDKVEHYSEKYSNISIHNKNNGGVSSARNLGITHAKGEFILFIDGDDSLCPNVLKDVYMQMKSNKLEIGRFAYNIRQSDHTLLKQINLKTSDKVKSGIEFLAESKTEDFFTWLYPLSNAFLKKSDLKFNTCLSFCEDKQFIIELLLKARRCMNFDLVIYNYRLDRIDSVTNNYSNKQLSDLITVNFKILIDSEKIINPDHKTHLKHMALNALQNSYYQLSLNSYYKKYIFWKTLINENPNFTTSNIKGSSKLTLLKNSGFLFYLRHYLPRALFHRFKQVVN